MKAFWKNSAAVSARLRAAPELLVTLDFDGTLSALAKTPEQARLEPDFKAALKTLARSPGVAVFILSGRALSSVRKLVGVKRFYYGGEPKGSALFLGQGLTCIRPGPGPSSPRLLS